MKLTAVAGAPALGLTVFCGLDFSWSSGFIAGKNRTCNAETGVDSHHYKLSGSPSAGFVAVCKAATNLCQARFWGT
jgi:hypothetical protein